MVNKDGKVVAATSGAIKAAAAGADWAHAPGFYMILTDLPGAESWPIAGATFILVPKQPNDTAATAEALKFFAWAYKNGDEMASSLDYIPMPDNVVDLIAAKWKSDIKDAIEQMPTDACQFFYDCRGCGERLKPKPGDCCVFCSYGSVPCPPVQAGNCCN